MSRLMSVAMTTAAVIERRKTVTRRKGWTFLKPGDTLTLCRKVQGRSRAVWNGTARVLVTEPLERLAEVEIVSVRREPLSDLIATSDGARMYAGAEMEREGFPGMDPARFVLDYFVDAQGIDPDDLVTRIEWRYVDEVPS